MPFEDANDLDAFGMDSSTRRRLKVEVPPPGGKQKKGSKRLRLRGNQLPLSLRNIRHSHDKEEARGLSAVVSWLSEAVRFVTPGKEGRGKYDHVGKVLSVMFHSTPEFERSMEDKVARRNGWTVSGAWPTSGKHIFDWEFDVWGERSGGGGV